MDEALATCNVGNTKGSNKFYAKVLLICQSLQIAIANGRGVLNLKFKTNKTNSSDLKFSLSTLKCSFRLQTCFWIKLMLSYISQNKMNCFIR